jgi:hypothetical protein
MTIRIPMHALALWLSAAASAWSAGAERLPLRQIDRPLVLPAKMWQERLVQNTVLELDNGHGGVDAETPQGFLPALPSYSFTDRLMWMAVPGPYFRYLMVGNKIDSAHGMAAKGLSLALDGGLTGIGYSSRDGFSMAASLVLNAKRPFSTRIWGEGQLGLGWSQSSEDPNAAVAFGSAGLGVQLSERLFLKTGYGLTAPVPDGSGWLQYGTLEGGVNFTPNLSLGLQVSLVAGESVWLNPGANLAFQW